MADIEMSGFRNLSGSGSSKVTVHMHVRRASDRRTARMYRNGIGLAARTRLQDAGLPILELVRETPTRPRAT